jgi:hypothetical protein
MSLSLGRGETILFPMPYVEAERPPYVVTNQRLVERTPAGDRTLQVRQLVSANRARTRPHAALGAVLLCIALGVAAVGAYEVFSVMGMQAAPWKALLPQSSDDDSEKDDSEGESAPKIAPPPPADDLPDDPSAERPDDAAWRLEVLKTRLAGMGLLALGGLIALLGLRTFKKLRYFVVCRTSDDMMRILVLNKVQQDLILATLQAVK